MATKDQGPVVQRLISANPGLNCNPAFFISLFKSILGKIFTILFRTSNDQIASKNIWTEFLSKFSDLKSNFTLTLGYLNPPLNNRGQNFKSPVRKCESYWHLYQLQSQALGNYVIREPLYT